VRAAIVGYPLRAAGEQRQVVRLARVSDRVRAGEQRAAAGELVDERRGGLPMISAYEWFSITTTTVWAGRGTVADGTPDVTDGTAPLAVDALVPADVLAAAGPAEPLAGPGPPHPANATSAESAAPTRLTRLTGLPRRPTRASERGRDMTDLRGWIA